MTNALWKKLQDVVGEKVNVDELSTIAPKTQAYVQAIKRELVTSKESVKNLSYVESLDSLNATDAAIEDITRRLFKPISKADSAPKHTQESVVNTGGVTVSITITPQGGCASQVQSSAHILPTLQSKSNRLDRKGETEDLAENLPAPVTSKVMNDLGRLVGSALPETLKEKKKHQEAVGKVKKKFEDEGLNEDDIGIELQKKGAVKNIRDIVQGKKLAKLVNHKIQEKAWDEYQSKRRGDHIIQPGVVVNPRNIRKVGGKFNPSLDTVVGWDMSEKYHGVRAVWTGSEFFAKSGAQSIHTPVWFREEMPTDVALDGELWLGINTFEFPVHHPKFPGMNQLKSHKKDNPKWKDVQYKVFDIPDSDARWEERKKIMALVKSDIIRPVEQIKVSSVENLVRKYQEVKKHGGEGLVFRRPGNFYIETKSKSGSADSRKLRDIPGDELKNLIASFEQDKEPKKVEKEGDLMQHFEQKDMLISDIQKVPAKSMNIEELEENEIDADDSRVEELKGENGQRIENMKDIQDQAMERGWPDWMMLLPLSFKEGKMQRWFKDKTLLLDLTQTWPTQVMAEALGFADFWVDRLEWEHGPVMGPGGDVVKRNEVKEGVFQWLLSQAKAETKIEPWLWQRVFKWWSSKNQLGGSTKDIAGRNIVLYYGENNATPGHVRSKPKGVIMYHSDELHVMHNFFSWMTKLRTRFHKLRDDMLEKDELERIRAAGFVTLNATQLHQLQKDRKAVYYGVWMAGDCWRLYEKLEKEKNIEMALHKLRCAFYYWWQMANLKNEFSDHCHKLKMVEAHMRGKEKDWKWIEYSVWNAHDDTKRGMFGPEIASYETFYSGNRQNFDSFLSEIFEGENRLKTEDKSFAGRTKADQSLTWVRRHDIAPMFNAFTQLKDETIKKTKMTKKRKLKKKKNEEQKFEDVQHDWFKTGHWLKHMNLPQSRGNPASRSCSGT